MTGVLLALLLLAPEELRYCHSAADVPRTVSGVIVRSASIRAAFRRDHPCPVTGLMVGACPGWSVDHVIPLVCGGCDVESNMQWLPITIKSCAGTECKDRWEQRVYCR